MRALRTDGARALLDAHAPEPVLAPGEALVRVTRATISRPDLDAAGPGSGFVGVLGSEFVGVVDRVEGAPGAARPASRAGATSASLVGRRVALSPVLPCGSCDLCTRGLAAHCREAKIAGLRGRDGGLAERVALPVAALVPIPDGLEDDDAVFARAVAQALHNMQHAAPGLRASGRAAPPTGSIPSAGGIITVLGDGPIGLLTAQALLPGAPGVRLLGRHEHKLALCEKWGIKARHERDAGRRADQDVVIDCTGSAEGFALAGALVRPRGRIVLCSRWVPGIPGAPGAPADLRPIVDNEIELVGSCAGAIGEALSLLQSRAIDAGRLVGRRFRLDDAEAARRWAAEPASLRALIAM